MALTNCPGTMDDLLAELGIAEDSTGKLELAGNAAARQLEGHTGWTHGFWTDASVSTRTFYANGGIVSIPEGISTAAGLVVKSDTGTDGTYATTLTNYILLPSNALVEVPARPYTEIRIVDGSSFPYSQYGRPVVQITALFGWPSVPDDIKKAWLIQAVLLYKASDAVFGAIQLGEGGFATRARALNPMAEALVERYRKLVAA